MASDEEKGLETLDTGQEVEVAPAKDDGFNADSLVKYATEQAKALGFEVVEDDEDQKWKIVFSVTDEVIRTILNKYDTDEELNQQHIIDAFDELLRDAVDAVIGEHPRGRVICQSARMYP
jgi:hypothetical protein